MFLKASYKVLSEDNQTEMENIMVEMIPLLDNTSQEERTTVYYEAVRRAITILTQDNKILMWGQFEIVDAIVTKGQEYNLQIKSIETNVEDEDIYLIK